MPVSFLALFYLFKYLRKAFICLLLLAILSCKDFKSWESVYGSDVNIVFERENEEWNLKVPKNLQSVKISKLFDRNDLIVRLRNSGPIKIKNNTLTLPLNPNADTITFTLPFTIDRNNRTYSPHTSYLQEVTINYQRKVSLISPEAGGLQIKYLIKNIQFDTIANQTPIFNRFTIETAVPLQEHTKDNKTHVTLYY